MYECFVVSGVTLSGQLHRPPQNLALYEEGIMMY